VGKLSERAHRGRAVGRPRRFGLFWVSVIVGLMLGGGAPVIV
jgi:hypothetical protein